MKGVKRTVIVIVLVIFGWRCWMLHQAATTSYLQISLKSSVEGQSQLFYNKGRGFTEADSVKTIIWVDGQYFNYRFRLPEETLYHFRFDPFAAAGTMRFKGMEIVNGLGHRLQAIDLHQWQAANQIRELTLRNNELTVVTEEKGSDPQMVIEFSHPLKLDRTRSFLTASLVGRGMTELIVIAVLMLLLLAAVKRSDDPAAGRFGQLGLGAIYLLACLYLIHVYSKGKWLDTIAFVQACFTG